MEIIKDWNQFLEKSRKNFDDDFYKKFPCEMSIRDFEQIRTLGAGAFGTVKLVRLIKDDRYFAVKIIDKEKIIKFRQIVHTLNEKRILQAIKFPFIVSMEYGFHNNDYVFFVMPFITGGELFSLIRRFGKFEENHVKFYASQVILALEYMHYLDLVYRDLKPENILLNKNGYLMVTDMGFCKRIQGRTYSLCGTPEYIAPEIVLSKGYGKSVDWWSMGVLIFELAAGYPPFYGKELMKIYEKIVAGKYKMPSHFSPELKDLIKNILQVDLTRRFGNLKNGVEDIKMHRFFKSFSWLAIVNQQKDPPYLPKIKGEGDASNFEICPEEPLRESPHDLYSEEFSEF